MCFAIRPEVPRPRRWIGRSPHWPGGGWPGWSSAPPDRLRKRAAPTVRLRVSGPTASRATARGPTPRLNGSRLCDARLRDRLPHAGPGGCERERRRGAARAVVAGETRAPRVRSGERRVGEEWRSRWAPYHLKKKKRYE